MIAECAVETERDDEGKIDSLRKRKIRAVAESEQVLVESGEKCLWAKEV